MSPSRVKAPTAHYKRFGFPKLRVSLLQHNPLHMQVLSGRHYIVLWESELREQTFKNANTLSTAISMNNKLLFTLSFMSSISIHETRAVYVISFQVGKISNSPQFLTQISSLHTQILLVFGSLLQIPLLHKDIMVRF